MANQTVIALIYDAMTIERHSGGDDPKRMPSTSFTIVASPAARGRSIELTLSGFAQPPGADARHAFACSTTPFSTRRW